MGSVYQESTEMPNATVRRTKSVRTTEATALIQANEYTVAPNPYAERSENISVTNSKKVTVHHELDHDGREGDRLSAAT